MPTAAHRRALEVAAQSYSTSEELLTAVLPEEDAHLLFSWLRDLPFMESTHRGLHPHDTARETLAADLRRRAPDALVTMRQRLADVYLRLLREAPRSGYGPSPTNSSTSSGRARPWHGCAPGPVRTR
ncbi:hypothetical protein [Streptomyces durhamensis]|uniref:hypothetical protein n=1 Tax=Streptomyces durhamensis TaxID=68194 RepID=UPI0004CD89CB|nr:hypothetical protein [Streptomyces durhamensis]